MTKERYRGIDAFTGDKNQPDFVKAAKEPAGMQVSAEYRQLFARQPRQRWHSLDASWIADEAERFSRLIAKRCFENSDRPRITGIPMLFPNIR